MASTAQLLLDLLEGAQARRVDKPWGYEFIIEVDDVIIKVIQVNVGERTSLQHHEVKEEVIIPLAGMGELVGTNDDRSRPGKGVRVRPQEIHRSVGPLLMLEVTTNHNDDVVRHKDDYDRASHTRSW